MLWLVICVSVVTAVWGSSSEDADSRVVNIAQGPVRGYKSPDGDFYVFYGIPYATAPTGAQKFQGPLPPPVWVQTYEAVDQGIVCPQYNYFNFILNGNKEIKENCLVTNIYVPETEEKNLPVLVYVHGGGYIIGHSNFVTPKHLTMTKRAIIVNFNYRLGAHGFLCLGTKDVPGNAGIKDQVALLRWVKNNIASFGGNPDDITIAGYSAGSSSVDLLMLSKMANNLFQKVIPESGANTAAFSVQVDPIEMAKNYAKKLNFTDVDNIYALEEFYKTASYELLTSVNVMDATDGTCTFSPCVERDTGVERFLEHNPVDILKSGDYQKRPMLYGFARMEGFIRVNLFEQWKDAMNAKFSDYLPADLQFESDEEKDKMAVKIKQFYFGKEDVSSRTIMEYINFFSDVFFTYPTLRSVKLQVEAGNNQIYLYEFAYTDEDSPIVPYTDIHVATHCAQTMAIHDGYNITHADESGISDKYKSFKNTLREIWLNFVTTGKPIPEGSSFPSWPQTGADGAPYMVLDKTLELIDSPLLEERIHFWDSIYRKHYRFPVPPAEPPAKHTEL